MSADADYQPGLPLVISGPSGVGKTTIKDKVVEQLGAFFSVSLTTRTITAGDTEGKDYFFISEPEFKALIEQGQLLEWAEVFGHYYGTPKGPVEQNLSEGRLAVMEIDVEGAIKVKRNLSDTYALFVLPPSEDELLRRLRHRGRDDEATIQRRFAKARDEIARARACGVYDEFIINVELHAAVQEAVCLVRTELTRRGGTPRS